MSTTTIRRTETVPRAGEFEQLAHMASGGKLLLRVLIGALMLFHGVAKIRNGLGPIPGMLSQHGLPPEIAYLCYIGEVIAPLMLIAGIWTRLAALVVAINMATAIALAHMQQILTLNDQGGWAIELQAMYLFGALAVMLLGAGRLSAGGALGRWN